MGQMNKIGNLISSYRMYNRLSAFNILIIFLRPLKFLRGLSRVATFMATLNSASTDTGWFVVMLAIAMFGFTLFAYVSFGTHIPHLDQVLFAFTYCFDYGLGN